MHRTLVLLVAVLAGCPVGAADVENPTGDCVPEDDGGRVCYHAPEADDVYLPDCLLQVDREYWRVFAQSETSAYVIPRPDATGLTYGICDGDDAALAEVFEANGLCADIGDPDVINAMTPEDALTITHALHDHLDFEAVDQGDSFAIAPWPPEVDLNEICAGPHDALLDDACEVYGAAVGDGEDCADLGYLLGEDEARALADALDQLYGIE